MGEPPAPELPFRGQRHPLPVKGLRVSLLASRGLLVNRYLDDDEFMTQTLHSIRKRTFVSHDKILRVSSCLKGRSRSRIVEAPVATTDGGAVRKGKTPPPTRSDQWQPFPLRAPSCGYFNGNSPSRESSFRHRIASTQL